MLPLSAGRWGWGKGNGLARDMKPGSGSKLWAGVKDKKMGVNEKALAVLSGIRRGLENPCGGTGAQDWPGKESLFGP